MDAAIGFASSAFASARACKALRAWGCTSPVGTRGRVARIRAVSAGGAVGGMKYAVSFVKLSNAGVVNGAATACSCAFVLAGSESVTLPGPVAAPFSPLLHAAAPSARLHPTSNQLCFRSTNMAHLRGVTRGHRMISESPREAGRLLGGKKKKTDVWVAHSVGFAICSPRVPGDPHDIAPRGS